MKRSLTLKLMFFVPCIYSFAQFEGLKKKIADKAKAVAETKLVSGVDAERDRLDSVDFNYAMTVIDNSGMMNVKDFDEALTKSAYAATNLMLKEDKDKTAAQRCRDILDMAEKFYEVRQYKPAEAYFLDAKLTYESEGLTNNINYSKVHADLGLLYATMGRYNSAEYFTTEALDIRERTLGKESKAYASSLNNRGVLYHETAHFNEAEKFFADALKTVGSQLGEEGQEYAIVLNNQAILLAEIGRTDQAVQKLNQAITILDKLKKKRIRDQVGVRSNLALLYQQTGKLNEAEAVYLKLEKDLGSKDPFYAGVLNNLALLYIQMNKLDKVEDYMKRSADVYKQRFGEQNPNYAKVLNDLGNFYRMQGKFGEADTNLQQAHNIRKVALSENHPDYVKGIEDLGILYWKKGDFAKAKTHYGEAMSKSLDFINRYFPPMSEAEKTKYWDVLHPRFQRFYNYAVEASYTDPTVLHDMMNYQIATKGLLLSATNKVKQAILNSSDQALIRDYLAWIDQKETLARYYSLTKEDLTNQKIDLAALESRANALERSLSERSKDFSQGYAADRIDYKSVRDLLTEQEAVVEVVRLNGFDKDLTNEVRYVALILTKGAQEPKMVLLENGTQLETRYAKFYKNAVTQRVDDDYSYEQYWSRIEPFVAGKKTIFFSPDGVYNQINLNTLKKSDGQYLVNRFDIVVLGNSKDLIEIKSRKAGAPKKDAFLLGFPDYGGNAVAALPGTKIELDGVSKILKANGYQVTAVTEKQASEKNLKALRGPRLLHIATHGYFLQDAEISSGSAAGISAESARNNPLLRSGLLLAGASPTLQGTSMPNLESNDNGVLTAYEAMNLSLEGTDLIILSACETGLGDVKAGEGVYGLQRAFQVAGANALVMSLWKVDDAATQMLMTNFYTNWAKTGDKLKAFKQAQIQLMAKYKEPYYWGAFVMMGM